MSQFLDQSPPGPVQEHADQAVRYVQTAVGIAMEYDSDTLPILDHYLRSVPARNEQMIQLVAATAGAYFGEVVRRLLGGQWDLSAGEPIAWRMVLPTGLSFSPAGVVAEAIAQDDSELIPAAFDAPLKLRPHLEQALARMGEVTVETFYSLCGRLDTLEHLEDVLLAITAQAESRRN
ncbi:MAG TPA: hypothetical protein VL172_18930 [Kofleriaceae bacterium]|nr:hypothetical protein [Kofleriaceae bacterium]